MPVLPMLLALPLLLQAAPSAPAGPLPPIDAIQRRDLTCAAIFAITASEQARGTASALAYPDLSVRGKRYFADVGLRVAEETGMTPEAVRDVLTAIVLDLQHEAQQSNDPVAVVDRVITPCLKLLDAAEPAPAEPDLLSCAVYFGIAYDEVYAREGLSPAARDLKTLAGVLESRARDSMRDEGLSGNEADAKFIAARDRIGAEVSQGAPDVDYDHCYDLAAPAPQGL